MPVSSVGPAANQSRTHCKLLLLALALGVGAGLPHLTYWLLLTTMLLDGLDGIVARRLNQCSSFGAYLDVFIDILTRGVLWTWSAPGPYCVLPVILETTVFTCTHKEGGAAWKDGCFSNSPSWVKAVMAKGFKTPLGVLAVMGLMGLPLWLWACRFMPGSLYASPILGCIVITGRLLCASVEVWVLLAHARGLLQEDLAILSKDG